VLRAVAGVSGGLLTWVVVATVGDLLLRAAWPNYAEVEVAMNFTPAMLALRLLNWGRYPRCVPVFLPRGLPNAAAVPSGHSPIYC